MFKRKKKKTGVQTPEYRKPTPPPPTSGSNAHKPNPNYIPPASVIVCCGHQPFYTSTQNPPDVLSSIIKSRPVTVLPNDIGTVEIMCQYETPCGWCCKWDKKCDKKIGCGDDKTQRGLRAEGNVYDDNCPMPKGIIRKIIKEVIDMDKAMNRLKDITEEAYK